MNKTNRRILLSIGILFLVSILFISINLHRNNKNKDTLTLSWPHGEVLLTNNKILSFDTIEKTTLLQHKNIGSPTSRNLTVILVKDLLEQYDITIDKSNIIEIHALDGFYATYSANEILNDNSIYIILQEDERPLDSNLGCFQVAATKDTNSTRWIHSIYKIEVK